MRGKITFQRFTWHSMPSTLQICFLRLCLWSGRTCGCTLTLFTSPLRRSEVHVLQEEEKKRSIINKSHQRVSHLYRTLLSSQCWNSPPSVLVTFMVPWWPQQNASWSFILISLYNCHQQLMVANDSTCILAINNVNWLSRNPQVFRTLCGYKSRAVNCEVNLPGTEDTVINQVVPPGGDSGIALCWVEACDLPKRGRLGCAMFGRGGLRSRIPRTLNLNRTLDYIHKLSFLCEYHLLEFIMFIFLWLTCTGSGSNIVRKT